MDTLTTQVAASDVDSVIEFDTYKSCYQCPHRSITCHSDCVGYLDRVRRQQEINKKRQAYLDEYEFKRCIRAKVRRYCEKHR